MKYLFLSILLLFMSSCANKDIEIRENYNFGTGKYNEPFIGILDSHPYLLIKSLEYPPFKWFASDTITFIKKFSISANEECIRSNSNVSLEFCDSLGRSFDGISIFINNNVIKNNKFEIQCNKELQEIELKLKIDPIQKDRIFSGFVIAKPTEIDIINNINMFQESNIIASWTCEQKIGYPIMIWLLWIVSIILCIIIIYLLFILMYNFIIYSIFEAVKNLANNLIEWKSYHATQKSLNFNQDTTNTDKKKTDENDNNQKCFKVPSLRGKSKWISEDNPLPPFQRKIFTIHNHCCWGIFPVFEGDCVTLNEECMSEKFWQLKGDKYRKQMKIASLLLYKKIMENPSMKAKYTKEQIESLKKGSTKIPGFTWHHKEDWLVMQLVKTEEHDRGKPHTGGSYVWNEKKFIEKYGKEWLDSYISWH